MNAFLKKMARGTVPAVLVSGGVQAVLAGGEAATTQGATQPAALPAAASTQGAAVASTHPAVPPDLPPMVILGFRR